jgi:hypothetical protein
MDDVLLKRASPLLEQLRRSIAGLLALSEFERENLGSSEVYSQTWTEAYKSLGLRPPAVDSKAVAEFNRAGVEVCIDVGGQPVWVVGEATGIPDRVEFTAQGVAFLLACQEAFGGKVISVGRRK